MQRLWLLGFILLTAPLYAAPVFDDLDRFQIPDEPAKQAPAPKKPAPKPVEDKRPEIVIRMGDGVAASPTVSRTEGSEISILHRSAAQLEKSLSGRSRFHVLFNANTPAASDKTFTAQDGKQYAVVLYGQPDQNYRQLVFNARGDQPLLAVAEKTADKLKIYKKYQLDLGVKEGDFKKTYPAAVATPITDVQDQTVYNSYEFAPDFWVLFKQEKPVKMFTNHDDFTAYTNQLQGIVPQDTTEKEEPVKAPVVKPKRSFRALVASGTIYDRMNTAAREHGSSRAGNNFGSPQWRPSGARPHSTRHARPSGRATRRTSRRN